MKVKLKAREDFVLDKRLQKLMAEKNVSLGSLCTRLTVNKSTLHNWINGVLPQSILQISRVADFFKITMDKLCFDYQKIQDKPQEPLVLKISVELDEDPNKEKNPKKLLPQK